MRLLRPWHLLLVAAALFVPLQAGALDGGGRGLTVSASLDYCGVGDGGIVCKIDASWSGVEGADRYTSTVTLADGSVRDFGTVGAGAGGGSTSLFVPYAGNGVYSVTVTAWGADPEGREKKIEDAKAGAKVEGGSRTRGEPGSSDDSAGAKGDGNGQGGPGEGQPAPEDPATGDEESPPEGGGEAPIDPGETPPGDPAPDPPQAPEPEAPTGEEVGSGQPGGPVPEGPAAPGTGATEPGSPDPADAVVGAAP